MACVRLGSEVVVCCVAMLRTFVALAVRRVASVEEIGDSMRARLMNKNIVMVK